MEELKGRASLSPEQQECVRCQRGTQNQWLAKARIGLQPEGEMVDLE